jgi:hypothetical protein
MVLLDQMRIFFSGVMEMCFGLNAISKTFIFVCFSDEIILVDTLSLEMLFRMVHSVHTSGASPLFVM